MLCSNMLVTLLCRATRRFPIHRLLAQPLSQLRACTVLGIECSFDDTAVGIVQGHTRQVLANVISSQVEAHRATGGRYAFMESFN